MVPSSIYYKLLGCYLEAVWFKIENSRNLLPHRCPPILIKLSRWLSLYLGTTRGLPHTPSSPPEFQVLLRVAKALLVLPAAGCRVHTACLKRL